MRIYLMRHGDYNKDRLNRVGKKQVKYSAQYLKNANISAIYSSPYTRCKQTASIVSKILNNIEVKVVGNIKEREKIASDRVDNQEEWYKNYLNINYSSKEFEGSKEFFDRINEMLDMIINTHLDDSNILIVGHSSLLYAFAAYFFKEKEEAVWMAMGNASIVCFENKK